MAWYKYLNFLEKNNHANFDKLYKPGEQSPDGGIYRCEGCGKERPDFYLLIPDAHE